MRLHTYRAHYMHSALSVRHTVEGRIVQFLPYSSPPCSFCMISFIQKFYQALTEGVKQGSGGKTSYFLSFVSLFRKRYEIRPKLLLPISQ